MKVILIALVLGTLLGCTHNENSPASAAKRSRAIVAAALAEMNYEGVPPPPPEPGEQPTPQAARDVLVSSTSLCFATKNTPKQADCTFTEAESFESDGLDKVVPRELRMELLRANTARQPIDLTGVPRVRVVNAADMSKLVSYRSWDAFYERYPHTAVGWGETPTSFPIKRRGGGWRCWGFTQTYDYHHQSTGANRVGDRNALRLTQRKRINGLERLTRCRTHLVFTNIIRNFPALILVRAVGWVRTPTPRPLVKTNARTSRQPCNSD